MNKIKTLFSIRKVLFGLLACSMLSCSDDLQLTVGGAKGDPHDPRKPIEVTGFEPKSGSAGQKMVIYGRNFGNDPELVKVNIGGTNAVVVAAAGNAIYCLVPEKSEADDFNGFDAEDEEYATEMAQDEDDQNEGSPRTIHVGVGAYGRLQEFSYEDEPFYYTKAWKVRTLAGKLNEKRQDEDRVEKYPLPFSDCGNFPKPENFTFDPVNPDHLWLSGDNGGGLRLLDLKAKTVTYFATANDLGVSRRRIRKVAFTADENHNMLVATDDDADATGKPSLLLIMRNTPTASGVDAFKSNGYINAKGLVIADTCNGVAVHPVTNSIHWSKWRTAEVYKYPNLETHPELRGNKNAIYEIVSAIDARRSDEVLMQFSYGESFYEMLPIIHPEGKYMYVLSINYHFITKSMYNEETDSFGAPIWFVGSSSIAGFGGGAGYINDMGMDAKMHQPREGVFVKNEEYVKAGKPDVYDFYFSDRMNHCIRKVTPEGVVTTFAGRGRVAEGTPYGYADGLARTEAMFDQPCAIAYSEERKAFYIGDWYNKRIREIYFD